MNKSLDKGDIGLIFHWGPYSIPAFDDVKSAKRRNIQNGSEWYKGRLIETNKFIPISGWQATQEYHNKHFPNKSYDDFVDEFINYHNEHKWNVDEWMKQAIKIGAKYVILTAKHHDGFCLWPTEYTLGGCVKNDLMNTFVTTGRKYGLLIGIYFSWYEFGHNTTISYMQNIAIPQVEQLHKLYKPDIWWFDGNWLNSSKKINEMIKLLVINLRKTSIVNDRLYGSKEDKELALDINYLGDFDFRVYSDRTIPKEYPKVPWESIHTIGLSWGYNKEQQKDNYKSEKELQDIYEKVTELGGRFLINLGPKYDGTLDENELESLKGLYK